MLRKVLRPARMLCVLMYRQNGDLANLLKSARKKSAPECPFECGGGGESQLGQCPNRGAANRYGASLTPVLLANFKGIYAVLSRIWKCRKPRSFGANLLGHKIGRC